MRYPIVVHKDGNSSYGVTVPTCPGASRAATPWTTPSTWRERLSSDTSKRY